MGRLFAFPRRCLLQSEILRRQLQGRRWVRCPPVRAEDRVAALSAAIDIEPNEVILWG